MGETENNMKKKYKELEVGESFMLLNDNQSILMKTDLHYDHEYRSVYIVGIRKGWMYSEIEENFIVNTFP